MASRKTKKPTTPKAKRKPGPKTNPSGSRSGTAEIHLSFHEKLYTLEALQQTTEAFGHLADISLSQKGERHTVTLRPLEGDDAETLADEFSNYALSRTVAALR